MHVRFLKRGVKHETHVLDLTARKVFKNGDQVQKFIVVGVRKPAADRYGVLGMEYVRRGRVVNNDGLPEVTTDLR